MFSHNGPIRASCAFLNGVDNRASRNFNQHFAQHWTQASTHRARVVDQKRNLLYTISSYINFVTVTENRVRLCTLFYWLPCPRKRLVNVYKFCAHVCEIKKLHRYA